jgi:protein TonB
VSHTVESALGDVRIEALSARGWAMALAAALLLHLLVAAGQAAIERARAARAPAPDETRIDVRLGPPGGRLEPVAPPPAPAAPPEAVAEPSRTERSRDAPPITPTAPPPPAPPGAALSSGLGEGGEGAPAPAEPAPPPPPPPAPPPPIDQAVLKAYANRAMALVSERINYPDSARRNQMEGRAVMRLTVDRRGRLTDLKMVEGTGHAPLDEAILAGARAVPNFGRLPEQYPGSSLTFSAAIRFMLMD